MRSGGKKSISQLKRVGTIPIKPESFSTPTENEKHERNFVKWPLLITAGDISSDGGKIILRSYNGNVIGKL